MVRNIITDLCHHLEIGIDGNLDIGNKRVIVGTPTITLTDNILTISCDTAGASIYYTLDGSTPTSASTRYTTAVTLSNSCTIKAIAIKGSKSSIVVSQDYVAILTAWRLVGNSEVHGTEIWSCGEYNPIDGKWHILVQPLGGSIADIALTKPLRNFNNVAVDTIEFPSDTEGKALVTRKNDAILLKDLVFSYNASRLSFDASYLRNSNFVSKAYIANNVNNMLTPEYEWISWQQAAVDATKDMKIMMSSNGDVKIRDLRYDNTNDFYAHIDSYVLLFILATPTTELVDAPQIAEAESYSMVISQGGKAVSWSSFTPNPS